MSWLNGWKSKASWGGNDIGAKESIALAQAVLDASSEHQNNEDQQHQAQTTAGVIAPVSAVWPSGDGAEQHEKQQH